MREVHVFLSPRIYDNNTNVVEGLQKNDTHVTRLDIRETDYTLAVRDHRALLLAQNAADDGDNDDDTTTSTAARWNPFLCLAFEDTLAGVLAARHAEMCVIAIASNHIERDRMELSAHVVALSMSEVLERFGVQNYYQIQYLPYVIHLHVLAETKVGYPTSLLDTLRGRFLKHNHSDSNGDSNNGHENGGAAEEDLVELDPHARRIIPREILGIKPDSLADVYINNVGWTKDHIASWRLNSKDFEQDIIRMFARLYKTDQMRGFITSGGTEGNFAGLWWNRDYLRHQSKDQKFPILVTSNETHYSISKAAQQLAMDGRLVQTTKTGEIDCDDLSRVLDDILLHKEGSDHTPTVLMNVNVGTTQTGAMDDLPRVYELLMEKIGTGNFAIHMDAALMGAVLPILHPFGEHVNYFEDLGVTTLAISGHKFFGSTCICGLCLTTDHFLNACFSNKRDTNVRYLTGLHDITPSGSRSGFNALSFHNTLCGLYLHTDAHRLKDIVAQCYMNVDYFLHGLTKILERENMTDYIIHPEFSLTVCFPRPSQDLTKKYQLMPVSMPNFKKHESHGHLVEYAGVCILLNVDKNRIDKFLADYALDRKSATNNTL